MTETGFVSGVARDQVARPVVGCSGLSKATRGESLEEGDQDRRAHRTQGRPTIAELEPKNGKI